MCVGAHCDPWVSVQVNRDRRSLRRRPPSPITQFRTKVILISDWLIILILTSDWLITLILTSD